METIDDIRREENDPERRRVLESAADRRTYSASPGARLFMIGALFVGILVLAIGAVLFLAPVAIVGLVIVVVFGFALLWPKLRMRPAH